MCDTLLDQEARREI